MSEKKFKIHGGLEQTSNAIALTDFDSGTLFTLEAHSNTSPVGASLVIDGVHFATEAYVDAHSSTINVNALAGSGLGGQYDGSISVNSGHGIYVTDDSVAVNVNAIAGNALSVSWDGKLDVNSYALAGNALAVRWDGSHLDVNAAALAGNSLTSSWDGKLHVNTSSFAQELAGTGLAYGSNPLTGGSLLSVNVNAIAHGDYTYSKYSMYTNGFVVDVNTNALASHLAGNALAVAYDGKLDFNAYAVAGNALAVDSWNGHISVNAYALAGTGLAANWDSSLAVNTNVIATRDYVDSIAQGLDIKASVYAATNSQTEIANVYSVLGTELIDGNLKLSDLPHGARILVKDSVVGDHTIYVWDQGSYVLSMASDATINSTSDTLSKGSFTFVENGNEAGKGFVVSFIDAINGVTWTQFSATGSFITSVGNNQPFSVYNDGTLNLNVDNYTLKVGYWANVPSLMVNTSTIASQLRGTGLSTEIDLSSNELVLKLNPDIHGTALTLSNTDANVGQIQLDAYNATVYTATAFTTANTQAAMGQRLHASVATAGNTASIFPYYGNGEILIQVMNAGKLGVRQSKIAFAKDGNNNPVYTEYAILESGNTLPVSISYDYQNVGDPFAGILVTNNGTEDLYIQAVDQSLYTYGLPAAAGGGGGGK